MPRQVRWVSSAKVAMIITWASLSAEGILRRAHGVSNIRCLGEGHGLCRPALHAHVHCYCNLAIAEVSHLGSSTLRYAECCAWNAVSLAAMSVYLAL